MKTAITALVAICLGVSVLSGPASARHRHRRHHHHVRHHRMYHRTTTSDSGVYYSKGVKHTHPHGDLDKFSRGFNHEVNNASKSVNHAFQGKKATPKGDK